MFAGGTATRVVSAAAPARDLVPVEARDGDRQIGGVVAAVKATADTLYLLGGPGTLTGKFQRADQTTPDPQGWYGVDLTQPAVPRWHLDTYNAANLDPTTPGNHAMWCGAAFSACVESDPPGGYGNDWNEWLDWRGSVADRTLPTTVRVTAMFNNDSEPGYDFLLLQFEGAAGMTDIATWCADPATAGGTVDETFTVLPTDYAGAGQDEVHLRWTATSDGAYSDEDCFYPSDGHSQIDRIAVYFGNALQDSEDFEPGHTPRWTAALPAAVGDFAKVWPRLGDIDYCRQNGTPQWAFIDDGLVVPGTGGSPGLTWTYGPGGYVVNLTGGLAGPDYHLNNEVWSPAIAWPPGHDGGRFTFEVYSHLPLSNGLFYVWHVQSSLDGGTTWGDWQDPAFIYYSAIYDYLRQAEDVTALLAPGRTAVRLALGAYEFGWAWGFDATDGTPAPYFDNVSLAAWTYGGPSIAGRDIDMFQSAFPAIGVIDYANLANNSVRVDMARNIASSAHRRNDPGDSMVLTIAPSRTGSALDGRPQLRVRLRANPLFDGVRTLPPGFIRSGHLIDGTVHGDTTYVKPSWTVVPNVWNFDLPDTGFFFPGDAFHYYVEARDDLAGDIGTTRLPADTTGWSLFPDRSGYVSLRYESAFKVRALPSLQAAVAGQQPKIIFWNDFANRGGENEWIGALDRLGYREGSEYDLYYTNGPSSGVGNGLGGRASALQLAGYTTMLYTSGDLGSFTLSNGDYNTDPGNDIAVVDAWLASGDKGWFATGNDLEYDLNRSGAAAVAFRDRWLAVTHNARDVRPLIGTQTAPVVRPILGNAPGLTSSFVAYGGCTPVRNFNAVTATGTGTRLAEFTAANGAGGVYPYAAMVYNSVPASTARVIWSPVDLMFWYNPIGATGLIRANLLFQVLLFYGNIPYGICVGVPDATPLAVRCWPNPFNPSVRIGYTLPARGPLSLKIYDVRGRLMRVLRDSETEAGAGFATWDGRDGHGAASASGVYFCEAKGAGRTVVTKLTLVR